MEHKGVFKKTDDLKASVTQTKVMEESSIVLNRVESISGTNYKDDINDQSAKVCNI